MPIEWPLPWIIAANALGLPALQLGAAWAFTRLPARCFDRSPRPVRPGAERRYERWAAIRRWKHRLPDGATWFRGGVAKRHLSSRDPAALRRFAAETRRGEACHWAVLALVPVFFLWNPPWADAVIAAYALAANLPCILAQRYNRLRLRRCLTGGKSTCG
jgi:glycosyl-4,4'-diaponeurosporenoate acyltransferase